MRHAYIQRRRRPQRNPLGLKINGANAVKINIHRQTIRKPKPMTIHHGNQCVGNQSHGKTRRGRNIKVEIDANNNQTSSVRVQSEPVIQIEGGQATVTVVGQDTMTLSGDLKVLDTTTTGGTTTIEVNSSTGETSVTTPTENTSFSSTENVNIDTSRSGDTGAATIAPPETPPSQQQPTYSENDHHGYYFDEQHNNHC